jgi:phosphopantetheine--protein transferase-like protein
MVLGIDLESRENVPASADPWSDSFYLENFTAAEIAYCVRQADPRLAFCGLWSAKEAVIKCHGGLSVLTPREVEIIHGRNGKPSLLLRQESAHPASGDYHLSISHAGGIALAICVRRPKTIAAPR